MTHEKTPFDIILLLEKLRKVEELMVMYKELSIIRFYLGCATDDEQGQDLMDKDDLITTQIKALEEKLK